ncbi:hypothetical protein OG500_31620 [Kitasatospora sp. NBC_01250]|uniref:hypothetical protein n=1 Tax=unclassified Kitasatospora TaxID=2633591 RepID=UPI002E1576EA|nr:MULTISPECIES: hypothetical protein [unclassified Kitasatospora]WSJ70540.1 hypothetical protein OG294_33085 [Kitasatospora sp. NBC_01302]
MTQRTGRAVRRILGLASAGIIAATGVLATGGTAQAAYDPGSGTIWNDEPLYPGWHVDRYGPTGAGRLIMQSDGNLVSYTTSDNNWNDVRPVWASNTVGCGAKAVMQSDGNLVVYAADGHACWASYTFTDGIHPTNYLTVEPDGHLDIWAGPVRNGTNGMVPYGGLIGDGGTPVKTL